MTEIVKKEQEITCHAPLPLLQLMKLLLPLPYMKLLPKPFRNRHLIDMQEQIALLIPYHLCRNIISKGIPSIFIRVKPTTIVDSVTMYQFIRLFFTETTLQTFTLHIEETLETWEPSISLV